MTSLSGDIHYDIKKKTGRCGSVYLEVDVLGVCEVFLCVYYECVGGAVVCIF